MLVAHRQRKNVQQNTQEEYRLKSNANYFHTLTFLGSEKPGFFFFNYIQSLWITRVTDKTVHRWVKCSAWALQASLTWGHLLEGDAVSVGRRNNAWNMGGQTQPAAAVVTTSATLWRVPSVLFSMQWTKVWLVTQPSLYSEAENCLIIVHYVVLFSYSHIIIASPESQDASVGSAQLRWFLYLS